jgi:hypothetical protein
MRRKLQIFVSSTFTDLISERQAAVSAILKAGHIPAGMELFTAGDKSQMDTIKRWIDESDAYMLILGGRYGSVEPSSGLSYTELEYDYAVEQCKPFFAIVIDSNSLEEKVKNGGGTHLLEMENPALLKSFREKVLSRISSFFKNESDIKLCVHESLADFRDNPDLKGWVSASEFEDTKPLHDEIAQLRAKIDHLQDELKSAPPKISNPTKKYDYQDDISALSAVTITVPENVGGPADGNLLNLFLSNKEPLINGVTNSSSASDAELFFYHKMAPKLIVHDLMKNEKVPGVRYRRSFVTTKGMAVLAELERRMKFISTNKSSENVQQAAEDTANKGVSNLP